MTDLSSYTSIGTVTLIKLTIPGYATLAYSDHGLPLTVNSVTYNSLGSLLGVSPYKTELRATSYEVSVSITGLLASNVTAAQNANIKGSDIEIRKAYYNTSTNQFVPTNSPISSSIKFEGLVNNVGFTENFSSVNGTSTFTLDLLCSSKLSILKEQAKGRRTNPVDELKFFPSDTAFKRVPEIRNSNFNFGAPETIVRVGTK